jgi:hypothetical protein
MNERSGSLIFYTPWRSAEQQQPRRCEVAKGRLASQDGWRTAHSGNKSDEAETDFDILAAIS